MIDFKKQGNCGRGSVMDKDTISKSRRPGEAKNNRNTTETRIVLSQTKYRKRPTETRIFLSLTENRKVKYSYL